MVLQDKSSSLLSRAVVLALEHHFDSDESGVKSSGPSGLSGRGGITLGLLSNKLYPLVS